MKKIYLLSFLLLSSLTLLKAQSSIKLIKHIGGAVIANGDNVYYSTLANIDNETDLEIINVGSLYNTYKVRKTNLSLNTSAASYFCTGINCYSTTQPNSLPFDLNVSDTVALKLYLTEGPSVGQSSVRYFIYNTNDATDTLSFIAKYNDPAAGVHEITKQLTNVSNVFPNPCVNKAQISFISSEEFRSTPFTIINSLGVVVVKKEIDIIEGKNSMSIDVESLPTGIYFATITANNSKIVKKFTVNK